MSFSGGKTAPVDVTVLIPAYNRAGLLPRALRSVLAQEAVRPARVLVVDDCSTDDTVEVAASFGAEVIRHDRNRGVSAARNTGLLAATSEWVALLDSDDAWLPTHLSRVWAARRGHVVVGASALGVAALGTQRLLGTPRTTATVVRSPAQVLFPENFVPNSSMLLDRATAVAVGGYDEDLGGSEDLDLLVRMVEKGTCLALPEVGYYYFGHEQQITTDRLLMRQAHRDVIASYEGREWWYPDLLRLWDGASRWDDARAAARDGHRREAAGILAHSIPHPKEVEGIVRLLMWRRGVRRRLFEAIEESGAPPPH